MRQQAGRDRRGAAGRPARLDLRRRARARRRLPRVAVRRPLHLPRLPRVPPRARRAEGDHLRGVPGTGYGILRNDPDMSSTSGKLPPKVAEMAREHTLLVLAKANSRSTVHRPAYLDYVGVKMFDDAGEVVGERRFLGLFSSAAYTESVWQIPLLREKAKDVLAASSASTPTATPARPSSTPSRPTRATSCSTPRSTSSPRWRRASWRPAAAASCASSYAATPTAATSACWCSCPATATTPPSASASPRSSRRASTASRSSSPSG